MKIYSYQDSLKIKEKCYRGNKITFGSVSEYGCGIPIYYDQEHQEIYKLVILYVYENQFVKKNYGELIMLKRIYKNETV